jgi:hypothetical protein
VGGVQKAYDVVLSCLYLFIIFVLGFRGQKLLLLPALSLVPQCSL